MADPHASALLSRHAGLDARIADEERRPAPDQGMIASLKKQKLKIKEALAGL
ncbi:YdcH family protein [Sphingomonas sp. PR090111-T3T-6A]|uniref:YdcH family protein n=1 Tax=Sphingomonas sp. PR090111-T3T-6A TaxID=685778 RepID=UPI00037E70BB|nr:YdcH family protein [Sphingomonas sp. PR090111-T3T-6A]